MLTRPLHRPLWKPLARPLEHAPGLGGGGSGFPITIEAPDGAFAEQTLTASGGVPVVYVIGDYAPIVADDGMTITPYMLIINGVETGDWFESSTTLPLALPLGSTIQVKDAEGNKSNILTALDPFTDINFTDGLRLQTHNGDNAPVGLYTDTACTTPATADGDLVAAWRDEIGGSGKTFIQATSGKRPLLKFVSGVPVLRFDGVDDVLALTTAWGIASALTVVSCRVNDSDSYSIFNTGVAFGPYWRFSADGSGYIGVFRANRINGYPSAMPTSGSHLFSIASATDYEMWIDSASQGSQAGDFTAENGISEIGANGDAIPFSGDVSAILICEDITQRALFEANITVTP